MAWAGLAAVTLNALIPLHVAVPTRFTLPLRIMNIMSNVTQKHEAVFVILIPCSRVTLIIVFYPWTRLFTILNIFEIESCHKQ